MPESALIVAVPEAEAAVGPWRLIHDRSARLGIPAHITLLYPFLAPASAIASGAALATLFATVSPFDFTLVEARVFPDTAYLWPDPNERFAALTAALVRAWPSQQPYGGRFASVVPHLTLASNVTTEVLTAATSAMRAHLPIRCRASEAWLMCSDGDGRWRRAARFEFAASAGAA